MKLIEGYSKLSKNEKLDWLAKHVFESPYGVIEELKSFWHPNSETQKLFEQFSENTISNYFLPYGVIPNVIINGKVYTVPMVTEESSVVAAAAAGVKFWQNKGGFKATILGTKKIGQIHFIYDGNKKKLKDFFPRIKKDILKGTEHITENMRKRGGGILDIELLDFTEFEDNYFQLHVTFETCDSMGANFINTCLEELSKQFQIWIRESFNFIGNDGEITVVMSILSNYTPECVVRAEVECKIDELGEVNGFPSDFFAFKFKKAVDIASFDVYRATTHNKGIMNGVDAVVIATGNDFRAIEASAHAFAARNGKYQSLSYCTTDNGIFRFWLDIPLSVGTVGGLTSLHPLAKRSLEILQNPSAEELMKIIASVGLAQNFSAVKSLTTVGIQSGHMKMHLKNILNQLKATEQETYKALDYFKQKVVSFSAVRSFIDTLRSKGKFAN